MVKQLVKYDAMCRAIDSAYRVDEVKSIRDKAVALEHYARQAKNIEAERRACEIRLRAERKYGQLDKKGKRGRGNKKISQGNNLVSPKQAHQWRKLGAVPQKAFDLALEQAEKPTTNGILRATTPPKQKPVASEALWLWGRLRDFARDILPREPEDVLRTMTPEML